MKSESPDENPSIQIELRKKAEELVRDEPRNSKSSPTAKSRIWFMNLRVHRVELAMQNQELREAQEALEESRLKYFDLFELAPVGYFTFDRLGMILEVNLTGARMLGVERSRLLNRPFSRYLDENSLDAFLHHREELIKGKGRESCELQLISKDGGVRYILLKSVSDSTTGASCGAT